MTEVKIDIRKKRKMETRKHIISAATGEFSKKGILATNTSDIAKKAGVAHGTIFSHFPTRDDLLIEVMSVFSRKICSETHDIAEKGKSLKKMLKMHLKVLEKFENFYARLVTDSKHLPKKARNFFVLIQSVVSYHIMVVAKKEMAEGKIKKMPFHFLFNSWIGLIHHYIANRDLFTPNGSVIKLHSDKLINEYLRLLASK